MPVWGWPGAIRLRAAYDVVGWRVVRHDLRSADKKDRVDDALNATRAAVEEGIVPGRRGRPNAHAEDARSQADPLIGF